MDICVAFSSLYAICLSSNVCLRCFCQCVRMFVCFRVWLCYARITQYICLRVYLRACVCLYVCLGESIGERFHLSWWTHIICSYLKTSSLPLPPSPPFFFLSQKPSLSLGEEVCSIRLTPSFYAKGGA